MSFTHPSGFKHVRKTITFTGAAGAGEAGTAVTVFTISGRVLVERITAFCTTLLTESGATATVSLGTAGDVDKFIIVTNAVDIDANEWWFTATPTSQVGSLLTPAIADPTTVGNQGMPTATAQTIIVNPLVTNVTGGVIVFDVWYEPITAGATLS